MTKKILITGKNSYVGNQLTEWLNKDPGEYEVVKESMRDDKWKDVDFSIYHVVVHVAGIAHVKETKENEDLYYKVNRDLAYEVAKKSKAAGVKQFIFLSSMSVYGLERGVIDRDTPLKPNSAYGKSKLEAEKLINLLMDKSFIVVTLRPPMIYGKGCRGNYQRLSRLALRTPFFLKINNKRSMIYIDNLTELVKLIIDDYSGGLFLPQNTSYVNTSEMVELIAKLHGKKISLIKLFNPLIGYTNNSTINKIFGDLYYQMDISKYDKNYNLYEFTYSIEITEDLL